ncbi:MAG TPA: hypothetical protein VIL07_08025 [Symbiobacteriaceae bacterium]
MHLTKGTAAALIGVIVIAGGAFAIGKDGRVTALPSPAEVTAAEDSRFSVECVTVRHVHPDGTVDLLLIDVPVYKSIEHLTKDASAVVVGQVVDQGGTRNLARNPKDPTQEAEDHQVMSQEYIFEVENYLKGSGEAQIDVVYPASIIRNNGVEIEEPEVPLEPGKRYVLFLQEGSDGYRGVGTPWQFQLIDGRAEARAYEARHAAPFQGLTEADLIRQILHAAE